MSIHVNLVFEDYLSEYVLKKLLREFGAKFLVGYSYHGHGFGNIKRKISGYNQACISVPFLILTDLDTAPCAVALIDEWFNEQVHPNMIFRIAVRQVESWLLADVEGLADFFGISKANFPDNPELEEDAKRTLISLAKRCRKRQIREDIEPIDNTASIGPNYNDRLGAFVEKYWDVNRAMERSESLKRAYKRLADFKHVAN